MMSIIIRYPVQEESRASFKKLTLLIILFCGKRSEQNFCSLEQYLIVKSLYMSYLFIHRQPSHLLAILLILTHFAAAGLLWPLTLSLGIKVAIVAILMMSLIYYLRQDALLTANTAVLAFVLSDEMQCTLTTRAGKRIACDILSSTFVAPYLTVLNLKPVGKLLMRSVVILPDSIDAEEFRQLRVWLRWKWKDNSEIK